MIMYNLAYLIVVDTGKADKYYRDHGQSKCLCMSNYGSYHHKCFLNDLLAMQLGKVERFLLNQRGRTI